MTHTSTEQPAINELCQWFNEGDGFKQGTAAPHKWVLQANSEISRQHARITELEEQLSAIGAGGVEPLRKQAVPASVITGAIYDFAGYLTTLPHKEAIHCSEVHEAAPMVKAITEWCKRRNLCTADARVETWREAIATHPTQQGLDLANCKGGKWLTVVYRDIQPGDESRTIVEHPKVSALSWSHALHDRDAAIAAQAKQGEQP